MKIKDIIKEEILFFLKENYSNQAIAHIRGIISNLKTQEDYNELWAFYKNKETTDFEKEYISKLLVHHKWNITEAAEAGGVNRKTFQRLITKHGLS